VNFEKPTRLSYCKKVSSTSHWEIVKSRIASQLYVMKEDTRVEGPWEYGEKPLIKNNPESVK